MALCDVCGNFDDEHTDGEPSIKALPESVSYTHLRAHETS